VVQDGHNRKPVGSSRFLFWKKEAYQGNVEQQALSFYTTRDREHAAVVLLWRGEFQQRQFFTYKPGNTSGKCNYYGDRNGEQWPTTYDHTDTCRQLDSYIDWSIVAFGPGGTGLRSLPHDGLRRLRSRGHGAIVGLDFIAHCQHSSGPQRKNVSSWLYWQAIRVREGPRRTRSTRPAITPYVMVLPALF